MKEIIVIGGGASGLVSSIYAAKSGCKVTLLEKNSILGKKILITGNGKCNYWNDDQNVKHYNSQNKERIEKIISNKNKQEILNFFNNLGIIPKIRDGYYYPYSGQATSIQTALIKECELNNVNIITNCEVLDIKKEKNMFQILTSIGTFTASKIILSTGSAACPKTGSTGDGYQFAKSLGHSIIKPLPALVQLIADEKYLKDWQGVRTDVSISLKEKNKVLKTEIGEIQLTDYGISGICVFNISSLASRKLFEKKPINVEINFLHPFNIKTQKEFISLMNKRNNTIKKRTIADLLDGMLNYKIINLILKLSMIKREDTWDNINIKKKEILSEYLTKFTLKITGTNSFDKSQTCTGGIPLSEINTENMQSQKVKGLYITGELLDIDGDCGGYNLTNAWITGMLAGLGVNND